MSKHELEPAEQKPAAWIIRHPRFCGKFTDDKEVAEYWENKEQVCTAPLYLHPQPAPDVAGLVTALEEIARWTDRWASADHPVATVAKKALAAYRQQGGEA